MSSHSVIAAGGASTPNSANSSNATSPGIEHDGMDVDMDLSSSEQHGPSSSLGDDPNVLYRDMYPKFVNSRRPTSANSSSRSPAACLPELDSASTLSSVMLLTPPPLLRRATLPPLTLNDSHLRDFDDDQLDDDNGVDLNQDLPSPTDKPYLQPIPAFIPQPLPPVQPPPTVSQPGLKLSDLQGLRTSPYLHRSPFIHIPERRSAPKRTFETSQTETVWPPSCVRKALQEPVYPICADNSLGLDIGIGSETHHIEHALMPCTPPVYDEYASRSPVVLSKTHGLRSRCKPPTGNPVSPPACRSPLMSLQIANALSALDLPDEGLRSVEAARYEMGKQEAEYIARRLAEEQKRRQAKERAASSEERGRSRAKKRTNSYSSGSMLS